MITTQPLGDGLAAAERLLIKLRHDPAAIAATLGAPVVLVVIFGYIFGSAISVPGGGNYRAYLVSGLFATIAANILPSMVAVAHARQPVHRRPQEAVGAATDDADNMAVTRVGHEKGAVRPVGEADVAGRDRDSGRGGRGGAGHVADAGAGDGEGEQGADPDQRAAREGDGGLVRAHAATVAGSGVAAPTWGTPVSYTHLTLPTIHPV